MARSHTRYETRTFKAFFAKIWILTRRRQARLSESEPNMNHTELHADFA